MNEAFRIYIEQLRDGHVEEISENLTPEFLDVNEKDLVFTEPVVVSGQAYLAGDELVLHMNVSTKGKMPCIICNELVDVEIKIEGFYFNVPLEEIRTGIYNYKQMLRETILLETPHFCECNQGNCPRRKEIDKYLKKEETSGSREMQEERHQPFADLDIEKLKPKNDR